MNDRRRVCFVTDELHPFTNGGIGRLLHNFIVEGTRRKAHVEFHLLSPARISLSQPALDAQFGENVVRLHEYAVVPTGKAVHWSKGTYAPAAAHFPWQAEAQAVALALRDLEREGTAFDEIEFPDFRGLAFGALQEKLLGRAFQQSRIVVRIHSTLSVLLHFEGEPLSAEHLEIRELERKALLDADLVIAHLRSVADFNQRFYDFAPSWRTKVSIEFPPVLDAPIARRTEIDARADRPIVFPSRTNPLKRPHLFVQATAMFMRECASFHGEAILACHVFHQSYLDELLDDVPADLRHRFRVVAEGGEVRARLLREGIVVVPSAHEALNLVAYEASAAGGDLVLNERCVAFGPGTPFVEGVNCRKFDGTVEDLVRALRTAHEGPSLSAVSWKADTPYWEIPSTLRASPRDAGGRVSVVVVNHDGGGAIADTLVSLAASDHADLEIIVVDDASRMNLDAVLLNRLESAEGSVVDMRVLRHVVRRGLAASQLAGLRAATGDFVLFMDAGDAVSPRFLGEATGALAHHDEFTGVLPTIGYVLSPTDLAASHLESFATQLGDAPTRGMVTSGSSLRPLWRRESLSGSPFDELLDNDGSWTEYLRQLFRGARFLVTPEVAYFASWPQARSGFSVGQRQAVLAHLAAMPDASARRAAELGALLLALPEGSRDRAGVEAGDEQPLRYRIADRLNDRVKTLPVLHPLLRRAIGAKGSHRGP
jgi:hypothetical protein